MGEGVRGQRALSVAAEVRAEDSETVAKGIDHRAPHATVCDARVHKQHRGAGTDLVMCKKG